MGLKEQIKHILFEETRDLRQENINFALYDELQKAGEVIDTGSLHRYDVQDLLIRLSGERAKVYLKTSHEFSKKLNTLKNDQDKLSEISNVLKQISQNYNPPFSRLTIPRFSGEFGTSFFNNSNISENNYIKIFSNFFDLCAGVIKTPGHLFYKGSDSLRLTDFVKLRNIDSLDFEVHISDLHLSLDWLLYSIVRTHPESAKWVAIKRSPWIGPSYEHHGIELGGTIYIQNGIEDNVIITTFDEFRGRGNNAQIRTVEVCKSSELLFKRMSNHLKIQKKYDLFDYNCETFCSYAFGNLERSNQIEFMKRNYWLVGKFYKLRKLIKRNI